MIGKGLKVKVKCPFCGTTTTSILHESKRFEWHVYECYKCKEKFRVRKGWRERIRRDRHE
jgi:transcription elongation factor Elf1